MKISTITANKCSQLKRHSLGVNKKYCTYPSVCDSVSFTSNEVLSSKVARIKSEAHEVKNNVPGILAESKDILNKSYQVLNEANYEREIAQSYIDIAKHNFLNGQFELSNGNDLSFYCEILDGETFLNIKEYDIDENLVREIVVDANGDMSIMCFDEENICNYYHYDDEYVRIETNVNSSDKYDTSDMKYAFCDGKLVFASVNVLSNCNVSHYDECYVYNNDELISCSFDKTVNNNGTLAASEVYNFDKKQQFSSYLVRSATYQGRENCEKGYFFKPQGMLLYSENCMCVYGTNFVLCPKLITVYPDGKFAEKNNVGFKAD